MINPRIQHILEYSAITALLIAFFGFFSVKVWDIDFWWHIAAGRHIVETHAIPDSDPFGVYQVSSLRSDTILKNYWLSQVAFFFTYDFWGSNGVIFLRAGLLALCLAATAARNMLIGAGGISALLVLSFAGMTLLDFTGERPQLFSFAFFSLAMLLLDFSRERRVAWPLYLLLPLMLLWANSHGGVVLGGVVLCLIAAGYAVEWRMFASRHYGGKWLFAILAAAVLCTLISPNGMTTYLYLFSSQLGEGELRSRTSEYASPVAMWHEMGKALPFYWGFILLAVVALPKAIKKSHLTPLLVIIFLGGLSLSAFRYIPFFMLYAAPYVALGLARRMAPARLPTAPLYLALIVAALLATGYGIRHGRAFQSGIQANRFPQGAVNFMQKNGLTGKMFNTMNWGGFLIWNLSPKVNVFIDGRVLDPNRIAPYTNVLWMTPDGQRIFEQSGFDLVLVPHGNIFTGESYPIINYLLKNPDWQAVYRDEAGYLFAKNRAS